LNQDARTPGYPGRTVKDNYPTKSYYKSCSFGSSSSTGRWTFWLQKNTKFSQE